MKTLEEQDPRGSKSNPGHDKRYALLPIFRMFLRPLAHFLVPTRYVCISKISVYIS